MHYPLKKRLSGRAFVCLLIGLGMAGNLAAQNPKTKKSKIHIYVLAGQSNMAGRGKIAAEDTLVSPRIWMLNKEKQWVPAKEPLHFDKPLVAGVGPGLAFAKAMADKDSRALIYLVPCAVGGTRIDLWKPGAYDSITKTHPYDDAMERIKIAMKDGTIKGIIWHQGESDCNDKLSGGYEEKLKELVLRFRNDIGKPKLPFVAGEIARFTQSVNKNKEIVNTAIKKVTDSMPHCAYVETKGLDHRGDTLHFDSPSARELGKRYAAAMKRIQQ